MQMFKGIHSIMVAGRIVIGGTYEDDMGCDDGCRTYIILLNFCLFF